MSRNLPDVHKQFLPDYDEWTPPEQLLALLGDKTLRTRDKVELVVGVYAMEHRGNHPSEQKIADILSLSKSRAHEVMLELLALGRAERRHGKFALRFGVYSNPLVSQFLAALGYNTEI